MSFAILPGVFQTYVPARWGEVPAILFGLGAIGVARRPEGIVAHYGRQLRSLPATLTSHGGRPGRPFTPVAGSGNSGLVGGVPSIHGDVQAAEVAK
jgi:branched-chain amino acid transport system permease protein